MNVSVNISMSMYTTCSYYVTKDKNHWQHVRWTGFIVQFPHRSCIASTHCIASVSAQTSTRLLSRTFKFYSLNFKHACTFYPHCYIYFFSVFMFELRSDNLLINQNDDDDNDKSFLL